MRCQRNGSNLKTHIKIALQSLGRDYEGATKGKTVEQMEVMLSALRVEQREAGIIKH